MRTSSRPSPLRRVVAVGALAAVAASLTVTAALPAVAQQAPAATSGVSDVVAEQIAAIDADKAARTPAEQKVDANLLYAAAEQVDGTAVDGAPGLKSTAAVDGDGRTEVDITASVDGALLEQITDLGGEVKDAVPGFDAVRALLPVGAVDDLAADAGVRTIAPAGGAMTNDAPKGSTKGSADAGLSTTGPITSSVGAGSNEADVTHGADLTRATYGIDGTGTKVCVLSDGIDNLAGRQATGDLPAVDVLLGQAGSGSEGTAMLELIHDIAPGATLGFATAFGSQAGFAQNIINLRADGCQVIVDDVTYYAEAAFQDDDVARAVSQVKADGAIYFTSAGNSGNLADGTSGSWQGDFQDAGASAAPLPADLRVHGWGIGATSNQMTSGSGRVVTLHWADPLAGSTNDYDLYVLNSTGTTVTGASTGIQNGTQDPFEGLGSVNAGARIVVTQKAGAANRYLALYTNRGRLATPTAGATYGHNASVDAISTAATPAAVSFGAGQPTGPFPGQFTAANVSETFSSDGPSRSFFAPNGTPLTPGDFSSTGGQVRNAIDITAADGATTTTPGFIPFFGTSAAAPDAAAMAALALSANPAFTPNQIESAMQASAIDVEAAGVDVVTGPGIAMAPALMTELGLDDVANITFTDRTVTQVVGDGDAFYEPGEVFDVTQTLRNLGSVPATGVTATLATTSTDVTLESPTADIGTVAAGDDAVAAPMRIHITRSCDCGTRLPFTMTAAYGAGVVPSKTQAFTLLVAGSLGAPATTPYAGPVVAIPDNNATGIAATVAVGDIGKVGDVKLTIGGSACTATAGATTVGLDHTWVGDLVIDLVSPSGTVVNLKGQSSNSGNNLCQAVFSDAGTVTFPTASSAGPFTGTYRPTTPLSAFAGEDAQGTWTLRVSDRVGQDTGSLRAFSIEVTPSSCDLLANVGPSATDDTYATPFQTYSVTAPGVLANDTDANLDALTATPVDDVDHGTLALSADGSFTYTPAAGFSGDDTFTYTAGDGELSSTPATVTITVGAPTAVSGTVTGPGGPVAGVYVLAYAPADGFIPTAGTTTAADGTYTIPSLPPGSYALIYVPGPASGLVPQWRGGATARTLASPVTVSDSGPPLTGIDEVMTAPTAVSGVVLDQNSQPVVGATVRAYLVGTSIYFPSASVTTGVDGSYTFGGLLPGDYQFVFVPAPGSFSVAQWYGDSPTRAGATTVVVGAAPVTGIDGHLMVVGAISGNAGAAGVIVSAYSPTDLWVGGHQAVSAADGSYTLTGLAPGTYKIAFFPPAGAVSWYGGATRTLATGLVVVGGATVPGIDR